MACVSLFKCDDEKAKAVKDRAKCHTETNKEIEHAGMRPDMLEPFVDQVCEKQVPEPVCK